MLSITLPDHMEAHFRAVAALSGQSLDDCVREMFQRFGEHMEANRQAVEDVDDALLIQNRLDAWEKMGRPGISLEEYAHSRGLVNIE